MRKLQGKAQWKTLIEESKDTVVWSWPDDTAREALRTRGIGHFNLGNGKEAEAELKKGIDRSPAGNKDPNVWFALAEKYQQNLNEGMMAMKCAPWSVLALLAGLLTASGWAEEPKIMPPRESTEWCNITSYDAASAKLPRVLLIGDSITSRYASTAGQALKDKAYLTVLATSKAVGDPALLDEIKTVLGQYTYAVVHFNIGLHGGGGKTAYRQGFPDLIAAIKAHAPGAKLIWATTTPCRGEGGMTQNVREFNKIAAEFVEKEGIPVDDLYGLVMRNADNPKVLWDGGGVHFTEEGAALQGKQVAQSILALLPAQP